MKKNTKKTDRIVFGCSIAIRDGLKIRLVGRTKKELAAAVQHIIPWRQFTRESPLHCKQYRVISHEHAR